jgi:hypothetical protein
MPYWPIWHIGCVDFPYSPMAPPFFLGIDLISAAEIHQHPPEARECKGEPHGIERNHDA